MSSVDIVDNIVASVVPGKGIKRKKRKSFIQNARKYGRQGTYGRGSHLDEDTYQYMVRVLEMMRDNAFPSFDEKLIFVNNVFEQTKDHEIDYAKNQIGSRVIDSLMKYASFDVINRFANSFMDNLRPICSDRFASHVLQKIMIVCAERGTRGLNKTAKNQADAVDVDEAQLNVYNEWTLKFCKYLMNNMEDFVWDTYANHIVRTVIELLGGLVVDSDSSENRSKKGAGPDLSLRKVVPREYTDLLLEVCKRLSSWPQLPEFPRNELTSGLLQVLIYSMKDVDKKASKTLVKKVVSDCFDSKDETRISSAFDNESSMRLLEGCIAAARPKTYTQIYAKFFVNRMEKLSLMVGANFTVQRLFNHCQVKEELETMFDEISTHFESILDKGNLGVIASVADACRRLQARQGAFVTAMGRTLHCGDQTGERQNLFALLVARMKPFEKLELEESGVDYRVNLHGSLILQSMLHFNKPIKVVNSLLQASGSDLRILFADPRGSRVMDAFAESKYVGEKSREKMARKLQGSWVQLACSKHGSRSFEKVWHWSQLKQRLWIIEELASVGASLTATEAGKIISSKLNVPLFSRSRKEWIDALGKEEKTKALFADIIGDSSSK